MSNPSQTLNKIKDILWNALDSCGRSDSKINAIQSFPLDVEKLKEIGDRPIIINNMNMNISVKLQNAVHKAIHGLDKVNFNLLQQDVSITKFIQNAYDMGIPLNDLLKRIEGDYCRNALSENKKNISAAARSLGINRTTLSEKRKRLEIGDGEHLKGVGKYEEET